MLIDSHCHLDRLDLTPYNGDLSLAIKAAQARGVDRMLCIGIDLNNAADVVGIAEQFENIYATVGVHPLDIKQGTVTSEQLITLSQHEKVKGIGETGLDYFYSKENKVEQQAAFEIHLSVATQTRKPVIIHTRDAREDTIAILKEYANPDLTGVFHCFTESWEMAKQGLDLGYAISFSGIVTFKNAAELRDVAKKVPLDRMLVETDSPYLAPVPHRGKKNEPKYVRDVAEFLADLKGVSLEVFADQTSRNFESLFLERV